MGDWYERQAPHCSEAHPFRLECRHEGGTHGRYRLTAYIGDTFVHSAFYDWNVWLGHAHGQLLMPDFIAAALASLVNQRDDFENACKHSADDLRARDAAIDALQARIAELEARNAVSERDAERWRWIRENANPGFTQSGKPWGLLCASLEVRTWPQIEAAIDAHAQGQAGEEKDERC